jgi:hypothetical protein
MSNRDRQSNAAPKKERAVVKVVAVLISLALISLGLQPLLMHRGLVYDNWSGDPVFIVIPIAAGLFMLFIIVFKPKWIESREERPKSRFRGWPR